MRIHKTSKTWFKAVNNSFSSMQKELFKSAMEVVEDSEKGDEITTPTDPNVSTFFLYSISFCCSWIK